MSRTTFADTSNRLGSDRWDRVTLLAFLLVAFAAIDTVNAQPTELVQQFESRTYNNGGFQLPYRLFIPPSYDSTASHPLVLAFHGAGERGTNNTSQISVHRLATAWADARVQSLYAPFVIAPQVPPSGRWENVVLSGSQPIRTEMETVLLILDSLSEEFNIDPDRIYVTGLSLGGYGTFDAVYRDPARFAGALAMSGGYDPTYAPSMASVPFWIIHGETDTVVPPILSKQMVTAFEKLGTPALYTNCGHYGCSALSNGELDARLAARPRLIFSGYPGVGHGPWAPWYDNPRMQDWLMSQHRLTPNAITFSSPSDPVVLSGNQSIEWTTEYPDDSVDVWFSADGRTDWVQIGERIENGGSLEFDTDALADTPFGRIEILLYGADGLVFGRQFSPPLVIDNSGDGPPKAELRDYPFRRGGTFRSDSLALVYRAGDPESSTVTVTVQYSTDAGDSFEDVDAFDVESSSEERTYLLDLEGLPNASAAVVRFSVSDGTSAAVAGTPAFSKETPRELSSWVQHPTGSSSGQVTISWIDPTALTGHTYRLDFQVEADGSKRYSVTDETLGVLVLPPTPIVDAEGPVFDGIRLRIVDVDKATVDRDRTGWIVGTPSLVGTIRSPKVTFEGQSIQLLATPADYRFTISDQVVDTTSSAYGFTSFPVSFSVTNTTSGLTRKILFDDKNSDGLPSTLETFYILEPDSSEVPTPAWMVTFVNQGTPAPVEAGDVFEFVTVKPVTEEDTYTFVGTIGVGVEEGSVDLDGFELEQNYPNPVAGTTSIPYSIGQPSRVVLDVFDILGRRVDRIDRAGIPVGRHTLTYDASGLAPGLYFYRMETRLGTATKSMLVIR